MENHVFINPNSKGIIFNCTVPLAAILTVVVGIINLTL